MEKERGNLLKALGTQNAIPNPHFRAFVECIPNPHPVLSTLLTIISSVKALDGNVHMMQGLLTKFAENPAENWKHKDCAIYLALSLSINKDGGTTVPTVIDVGSFFSSVIVPELQSQDVNAYPVLKAAEFSALSK